MFLLPLVLAHENAQPDVIRVSRALVQARLEQTSEQTSPGLERLVRNNYPSPSLQADTLRTIRDTARARDGMQLRRAWLEVEANPLPDLHGELRLDLARLFRDDRALAVFEVGFAQYSFTKGLALAAGLFELPFSLFELVHDPEFELAEKGPAHELLEHLGYAGSDVGVMLTVRPVPQLTLLTAATSAGAVGAQTSASPGLFVGRVVFEPWAGFRVGAGVSSRPTTVQTWFEEYRFRYQAADSGTAYAADATLTSGRLTLRTEFMAGRRTDNDVVTPLLLRRGAARNFAAGWVMASFRQQVGRTFVTPAFRAEYLDADREHSQTGGILYFSAGINFDFSERFRVLWDLSQHYVQPGTLNWNFDIIRFDTDYLTGALQLQVKL